MPLQMHSTNAVLLVPSTSSSSPATFEEYIDQLPLWDKHLLQDIALLDAPALIVSLSSDASLYIVSDGGASLHKGSFGAGLADDDTVFVKIYGSTKGDAPRSYRAESYGCLAILRFLYHFRLFHQLDPIISRNKVFCDNKGLISRLDRAAGPQTPFPHHFLCFEINLEMQICDTLQMLAISLTYHHVKGHQDGAPVDKTPLTRQARLNVRLPYTPPVLPRPWRSYPRAKLLSPLKVSPSLTNFPARFTILLVAAPNWHLSLAALAGPKRSLTRSIGPNIGRLPIASPSPNACSSSNG
jgi:hypothetical protein